MTEEYCTCPARGVAADVDDIRCPLCKCLREPFVRLPPQIDFLQALATGRPIRRRVWINHPPTADAARAKLVDESWYVWPVALTGDGPEAQVMTPWINLATGRRVVLTRVDYLAKDWEVLP